MFSKNAFHLPYLSRNVFLLDEGIAKLAWDFIILCSIFVLLGKSKTQSYLQILMVTMWLTSSFQGFGLSRKWSLCWKNFHWHPVTFSHKLKAFIQLFKAVEGSSSSYIRGCILIYKSQKQRYFWGNTENEDHKSQNKACQSQGECVFSPKRHSSEGILCLSENTRAGLIAFQMQHMAPF